MQPRLITRWREVHGSSKSADAGSDGGGAFVSDEQRAFFGLCASWKDVLYTQRPYPTRWAGMYHAWALAQPTVCFMLCKLDYLRLLDET